MANREHLQILNKGVKDWNSWRKKNCSKIKPDLREVDLQGRDLREINLESCDLRYSDLRGADLGGVWLTESLLMNANLNQASLTEAHLEEANLSNASLIGANLECSWFTNTNCSNTDLTGANLIGTRLYGTNFQGAILEHALLSLSQPMEANFSNTKMTGALVKDWYPNKETILKNIDCKFVYLNDKRSPTDPRKLVFCDKFPHDRFFHPNEFIRLVCAKQFFFDGLLLEEIIQEFEALLRSNPSGKEHLFHKFIKDNPSLLDMYGRVISKPQFHYPLGKSGHNGKTYVEPDFLIIYPDNSYKLVEIEKPGKKLRTKQGHQSSLVTQASWQLNEWDAFIKQYAHVLDPEYPNIALKRSSLLIIGRGDDNDEKAMLSNNCPHGDVYTYDDLLERAKSAIENLTMVF